MKHARWFLTAAGAVTAIGLAAPVHADNTANADGVFLGALDHAGIEYADEQTVISMGKGVCGLLTEGRSPSSVARSVRMLNHHLAVHNAAQFVAISAQTYCPTQLSADTGA